MDDQPQLRRRGSRLLVALAAALTIAGCAGVQLKDDLRQVRTIAREARDNGAYKCAPRELALADTNIEFVDRELNQGDYFRARDHLRVADHNAREAYRLSPRERCLPPPPGPGDADGDGIADNVDKCPHDPEDKDGFQDADGCPDPDNDKDGVLDAEDKCPNDPGPPDNAGCPKKYEHIVVTQEKIELKQKIFFDTNKATIQPRSFSLLDEIAQVMRSRPSMTVRIEGHTDSRGKHAHNMALSSARAESVRQHLVGLGIEPSRMQAQGYGPDQPIETNKTAAGREKNRRVEFFITQQ
ncbi:MAG TPA: OmpA family protein [Polyangia bacterium]|nr:OmpA family protein [Polyangia bacterium]